MRRAGIALLVIVAVLLALALEAFWLEPSSLRLVKQPVVLENAGPLGGLRIAVISDLHGGARFIDEAKIARVATLTNAAKPDLILLAGDYVVTSPRGALKGDHHIPIEKIARILTSLHAPLGVYAVIGNHDRWENAANITQAFERAGIPVLENASRALPTPRGPLYLAGIGDYFTHHSNPAVALADVPAEQRALCFTHSPDIFPEISTRCALTVAGHTHGGQVALPLVGRLVVPSRYGQRYAAGIVREGGKTLFVSTGIGTSIYPVRLGVPPQIDVLDIQ